MPTPPPIGPPSPRVLHAMDILRPGVPAGDFDPAGAWTQSYLIWTTPHLTRKQAMVRPTGLLTLCRTPSPSTAETFALHIAHDTLLEESNLYAGRCQVRVRSTCRTDGLASPLAWSVESRFLHDGVARDDLAVQETGRVDAGTLRRTIGRTPSARSINAAMTADWCLFEALQRTADAPAEATFDLFDGFHTLKPGHRLRRRPDLDEAVAGFGPLRCVTQIGWGRLPQEYWLDAAGRMVCVVCGTRTYALSADAESDLAAKEASWIYSDPAGAEGGA